MDARHDARREDAREGCDGGALDGGLIPLFRRQSTTATPVPAADTALDAALRTPGSSLAS